MKNIVITGVSSGIGKACAVKFIKQGYRVFGSVRSKQDAQTIIKDLNSEHFVPLIFDITKQDAVSASAKKVIETIANEGLCGLINNAGIAVSGPLMHLDSTALERQFKTNVIGTMTVTRAFLPLLGAQANPQFPPGKIINISSVSGKIAYPFLGAYAASKHALEALSHALRRELMIYGIDVLLVAPGSAHSRIWQKNSITTLLEKYGDSDWAEPLRNFKTREKDYLQPEQVADKIWQLMEKRNWRVRFPVVTNYLSGWLIPRILPARLLDYAIRKVLRLRRIR